MRKQEGISMRYLTLSWDDGLRQSTLKTAEIYEKYGLRAEFNVMAAPPNPEKYGDFALWNELQARGHVIQPHGYNHTNKASVPFAHAQDLIHRCLEVFTERLHGFAAQDSIFNFPYNASTPEFEAWLPSVVRAFRTGPGPTLNPLPQPGTVKLTTSGWVEAEAWLDTCLEEWLSQPEGWLIYNTHGLDGEGWGPIRSDYLDRLLARLVQAEDIRILPARDVLRAFDSA
jgi:peptidoglycan/xylan/chitin deacetylase (PgdA/CDA1 family)